MFHYRSTRKKYVSYPKPVSCDFCNPTIYKQAIYESKYVYIIPNRVFYDVWEMRSVKDHLLLIPKKHVKSLRDLPVEAKAEIMDLIGDYETNDYNIYARAVGSHTRSVTHQHTHLIKTQNRAARIAIMVRRPYYLIKL